MAVKTAAAPKMEEPQPQMPRVDSSAYWLADGWDPEAEISTTDDEMFFHEVDLPLPQKGCAPRKAPAMDVPLIAAVDAVGKVQGMPTCPTFALGGLKSVPVCAYPIVQKLPSKEVPEVAVDTFVMGSSKKDSPAELPLRVSAGEEKGVTTLANIAGVSVKNTFLHFDFAAPSERGMGSRRRANSC